MPEGRGSGAGPYASAAVCLLLVVGMMTVYLQVGSHEFINFDDNIYITENSQVQKGISSESFSWAFGFSDRAYWHPVTWLSHMLDCELFGLNPGMHHLMNLLFHVLNGVLLFFVLKKMTGSCWRSAFAAALFAVHPINVDTVAWIAERKNLLSTFFWLLTLLAYAFYVQKPTLSRYAGLFCAFIPGILSKPMLVTLPFVLLLLDYWPFARLNPDLFPGKGKDPATSSQGSSPARLVLEKVPLLVLSVFIIIFTLRSFRGHVDVISTDIVSIKLRIANALVSYIQYLSKMIWPWDLTIYYPFPQHIPIAQVLPAGAVILGVSMLAIAQMRKRPYILVGWLWFLGTLVPVSGIVQAGLWPAMAERWAYVPLIGLFIIVSWGSHEVLSRSKHVDTLFTAFAAGILVVLMLLSWKQAGYWKDDFQLFSHALAVNDRNSVALGCLGDSLADKGKYREAFPYYVRSLGINPNDPVVHNNIAIALLNLGQFSEAIPHYQYAMKKYPEDRNIHIGLGTALAKTGENFEAAEYLSRALRSDTSDADTHFKLAVVLVETGRIEDAVSHYREALKLKPDFIQARKNLDIVTRFQEKLNADIALLKEKIGKDPQNPVLLYNLGVLYEKKGDAGSAEGYYTKVLSLQPRFIRASERLSIMYSLRKDYPSALVHLRAMLETQPDNPHIYYNIACVYARQGSIEESLAWLDKAIGKGFHNRKILEGDPDLENIRDTARYKEIIKNGSAVDGDTKELR